jgi:type II secretion system (T2SS) protein E
MSNLHLQSALVRRGLVTSTQLSQAVEQTRDTDRSWLEHLLLLGALDEEHLCHCVSSDFKVPRCDPERIAKLPDDVLGLIPPEVVVEHRVLPLWMDRDGDMHVAMLDPTDSVALEEIQFFAGGRIMREVAIATAIAWAIYTYYGARSALWPRHARNKMPALVVNA